MLREALRSFEQDGDAEEDTQDADQQHWRRLLHAKAEARARYDEGRRLARQRDAHVDRLRGASPPAVTSRQWHLLQRWDSGELRRELDEAVATWGHRRLGSAHGEHLDIGCSTGGGSRRLVDGWVPPDWREFLSHSDTA